MKQTSLKSALILLTAAIIWGFAFVAQSIGMDYVGPFTFNSLRCLLGGLVLLPYIAITDSRKKKASPQSDLTPTKEEKKTLLVAGLLCGVTFCIAGNLQQIGIQYTTVGKAGFITALYIVIIPVLGLFLKRSLGLKVWISIALAVLGLYLLSISGSFTMEKGDFLVLLCAFAFSAQMLLVDHFSPKVDGVKLACIEFFTCGILSGIAMLLFEHPTLPAILQAWLPLVYAGALSCGIAYTFQIIGQRDSDPTLAALIMSFESVVSLLGGWLILSQKLTPKELLGCAIMFAAIILSQLPERKKRC